MFDALKRRRDERYTGQYPGWIVDKPDNVHVPIPPEEMPRERKVHDLGETSVIASTLAWRVPPNELDPDSAAQEFDELGEAIDLLVDRREALGRQHKLY